MAIIKCKMCGGDLTLVPDQSVLECEYCGTPQTVPSADSERKLSLFARANKLRAGCNFDKAAGVYESIVAEFPEEAEAYWGLVLCKYGIEYVDDPATGKKVPTCHRSSYESVMDDPNLDMALENADSVASRLYREEAKAIENIRRGIVEVSSKEEPYDIFICYKESDTEGNRTLDSVLAQDLYDVLTDKGYRVFFARISLEDKLGADYESFIFAALHSAKIMLCVGTDYEHFNAVWVKNEWSRYLKLMEKDKDKHLVPCFKGIDAYDLPREFQRFQAQDLDKLGAHQDILRGIEKILPRQVEAAAPAPGTRSLSPNLESLMKRAFLFLEDKEWANADKYFDDILDIQPECAEAYMGKCLAMFKCSRLEDLVDVRLGINRIVQAVTVTVPVRKPEKEAEIVSRYVLPGYLEKNYLEKMFKTDLRYDSQVESRQRHVELEEKWFETDKNISKALRYADGAYRKRIENVRADVLAALRRRVEEAKQEDENNRRRIEEKYQKLLEYAEVKGKDWYDEAVNKRDAIYDGYMHEAQAAIEANNKEKLLAAQVKVKGLGDYKESASMVEILQEKIDAINKAEEEARERERQRQEEIRRKKEADEQHRKEIRDAYLKEYPYIRQKDESAKRNTAINVRLIEIASSLKTKRILRCILAVAGIISAIVMAATVDGKDADPFMLACLAFGGCAVFYFVLIHMRGKQVKERKELLSEQKDLKILLDRIQQVPSITEYSKIYEMRQTEEGRAQLEQEERKRRALARQAEEEAKAARKRKRVKRIVTTAIVLAVIVALLLAASYVIGGVVPKKNLEKAQGLYDQGNYQQAYDALKDVYHTQEIQELLEQISRKGRYGVVEAGLNLFGGKICNVKVAYNDHGYPGAVSTVYTNSDQAAQAESSASGTDVSHILSLEYTYYPSGNLKSMTARRGNAAGLSYSVEFYDRADSDVFFSTSYKNRYDPTLVVKEYLAIRGAKSVTDYAGANKKLSLTEEGFPENAQVERREDGSASLVKVGDKEYTLDEKGELTYYKDSQLEGKVVTRQESGKLSEWILRHPSENMELLRDYFKYDNAGHMTSVDSTFRDMDYSLYVDVHANRIVKWIDFSQCEKDLAIARQELLIPKVLTAMGRSVAEGYEMLKDVEATGKLKELKDICEYYAPYCGTFGNVEEYPNCTLESNVTYSYGKLWWHCVQNPQWLCVEVDKEFHVFFQGALDVVDEAVVEEFGIANAVMLFKNGKLYYDLSYWNSVNKDKDGNIIGKNDLTDWLNMTLTPVEAAQQPQS